MSEFSMVIDGALRGAASRFEVVDPATGEAFDTAPDCTPELLDEAMAAAARAFTSWQADDSARCDALRAAGKALSDAAGELAPVLTREQGKPLAQAALEVAGAGVWLQYYADLQLAHQVLQDDERGFVEVVRRPLGVVAAIAPWNFPILLACWKIAPALRAGNTVVLKPSPYTPLSSLKMVEILGRTLPAGVLNVVSGGAALGGWMTAHPTPRKVSFTGSVSTGKKVAAAAADDLKRITLELGGNDPAIVLDDADPASIASQLFWSAFANSGQVCVAVKRVYVPERLHDDLVDALAAEAAAVVVGHGMADDTQLGPINNRPQLDRVAELVRDATGRGAHPVVGGDILDRPGYFFAPTLLTGVTDGTRIVDEEQFGPVLPVVTYTDVDDVVGRVNGSTYGLGASVWSANPDRAEVVARQLDVGTAWVNQHGALAPHVPFGGLKWSGLGVENGPWGHDGFTDIQVVHRPGGPRRHGRPT